VTVDYKVRLKCWCEVRSKGRIEKRLQIVASGDKVRADTPEEAARQFCGRPVQREAIEGGDQVEVCVPPQDVWVTFYRPSPSPRK
jgi:hypothetical protein